MPAPGQLPAGSVGKDFNLDSIADGSLGDFICSDLIALADKLGVNLIAGHQQTIEDALTANHEAILSAYVQRQTNKVIPAAPVLAPPELLDDDPEGPKEN
jgi:hypothetical protein